MKEREKETQAFIRLLDIMDELRNKCPWDMEQTQDSLRPLTIEETYELSDAILNSDSLNISKELGDLLLHIVFYAKIGSEKGEYDISDVINKLCDKLVFRHPHVFGETEVKGAGEVIQNWEKLKTKEKEGNKSVLSGVPQSLPSIVKSYRVQDKVRAVGFDWQKREDVWGKVKEEIEEFEVEVKNSKGDDIERMENEFGDILFSLVNASRLYGLNPDSALEKTNLKFIKRFNHMENEVKSSGQDIHNLMPIELEELWVKAKKIVG